MDGIHASFQAMKKLFLISSAWMAAFAIQAATYYVDFDGGNNSAAGTSTGAAWKHCPGDPNATGTADSTSLVAGDTVIFKGGIIYRGTVTITWSGTAASPIVFDGNTAGSWGTGRAIMDGSDLFSPTWTPCADAADCGGNTNFASIFYTTVPSGVSNGWPHLLYNGTNQTHTAQHPNPTNRFLWDINTAWTTMTPSQVGPTSVTDTAVFTNSSASAWDEAWLGIWAYGNSMELVRLTNFITATDTVQFTPIIDPYTDRDSYYSIFNHVQVIDQAGEHCVSTNSNRLYLWPPNSIHPSNYVWSVGQSRDGFNAISRHNVTVVGFTIQGIYSEVNASGGSEYGVPLQFTSSTNALLLNNDIRFVKNMDRDQMISTSRDRCIISSNSITRCYAAGIRVGFQSPVVISNYIKEITGTAIYFTAVTNGVCSSNVIDTVLGTHANGMSHYQQCNSNMVSFNRIRNCFTPITLENGRNWRYIANLVDAVGQDQRINTWSGTVGTNYWIGNTLVNNSVGRILNIGVGGGAQQVISFNNIICGGGNGSTNEFRYNNIYTDRNWWQNSGDGWELGTNEVDSTEADLFASSTTGDWRLKAGSVAIDTGTNGSPFYTTDIDGQIISGSYDIGAFGYQATLPAFNSSVLNGTMTLRNGAVLR